MPEAPWTNVDPNAGRFGGVWIAVQEAFGTPATVPTHALRVRSFMPPLKQFIRVADEFADRSMESKFERIQGVQIDNRSLTVEATMRDLALLLGVMCGNPAAGKIIPKTGDYAVYAPGKCLTIWQLHPGGNTIASDVQVTMLQADVASRANVTLQIGLGVTKVDKLNAVPTPAPTVSQEVLQFRHFWVKYDGVVMPTESGALMLTVPMASVDAAQGQLASDAALLPLGWERNAPRVARINFTTAGTPEALKTGYELTNPADLKVAEAGFTLPGGTPKTLSLKLLTGQVKGHDPSNGLDRFTVQHGVEGVSLDGLPPFEFSVPV